MIVFFICFSIRTPADIKCFCFCLLEAISFSFGVHWSTCSSSLLVNYTLTPPSEGKQSHSRSFTPQTLLINCFWSFRFKVKMTVLLSEIEYHENIYRAQNWFNFFLSKEMEQMASFIDLDHSLIWDVRVVTIHSC